MLLTALQRSKALLISCTSPDPIGVCVDRSISEEVLQKARLLEHSEIICWLVNINIIKNILINWSHLRLSYRCWKEVHLFCRRHYPLRSKLLIYPFCNQTEYYNVENCQDGIGVNQLDSVIYHKNSSTKLVLGRISIFLLFLICFWLEFDYFHYDNKTYHKLQ